MNNLPPGISHADIDHAAEGRDEPENNCLRDAAREALEALELHGRQYPHMVKGYCVDAIASLRAALAHGPLGTSPDQQENDRG
jgi:hypothetical protein